MPFGSGSSLGQLGKIRLRRRTARTTQKRNQRTRPGRPLGRNGQHPSATFWFFKSDPTFWDAMTIICVSTSKSKNSRPGHRAGDLTRAEHSGDTKGRLIVVWGWRHTREARHRLAHLITMTQIPRLQPTPQPTAGTHVAACSVLWCADATPGGRASRRIGRCPLV